MLKEITTRERKERNREKESGNDACNIFLTL
jgi:hypothetical protein